MFSHGLDTSIDHLLIHASDKSKTAGRFVKWPWVWLLMILLSQKHAAPPAVHQWDFLRPPEDLRSDWLPLFPHHSTLTGGYCCSAANSMVHISDWSENRSSTQTHITWNRSTLAGKDLYIYKYITHTHTHREDLDFLRLIRSSESKLCWCCLSLTRCLVSAAGGWMVRWSRTRSFIVWL